MARISTKERHRRELWALFVHEACTKGATSDSAKQLLALHEGFSEEQHMHPRSQSYIPTSNWATHILPQYSESRWRTSTRMDPSSFEAVTNLIKDNPIFYNNGARPQDPVETQLKIALYRLAHSGSGSGYGPASSQWGVSEGHLNNCTRRVIYALFQLRDQFVHWPTEKARKEESFNNALRAGYIGAVGKVDGTDIVLEFKPGGEFNGEQFCNRKKRYALDLLCVCDSDRRFTYMLTGFSNATDDARVYSHTKLCRNPTAFFSPGQYLLGDSAYTATHFLVPPYKASLTAIPRNRRFNRKLSSIRIDIEHAFGMLKGRWKSLTGLRLHINDKHQYEFACMWITACVVLHNILLDLHDEWRTDEGWWTAEEEEEHDEVLADLSRREVLGGFDKREEVQKIALNDV